jgi:hypothetical protein
MIAAESLALLTVFVCDSVVSLLLLLLLLFVIVVLGECCVVEECDCVATIVACFDAVDASV